MQATHADILDNYALNDQFGYGLRRWETTLQSNVFSIGWAHTQSGLCTLWYCVLSLKLFLGQWKV